MNHCLPQIVASKLSSTNRYSTDTVAQNITSQYSNKSICSYSPTKYSIIKMLQTATVNKLYNAILWGKHPRQSKVLISATDRLIMLLYVSDYMENIPRVVHCVCFHCQKHRKRNYRNSPTLGPKQTGK